ncbi:MAG: hypothetical protein ACI350_07625 [Prevotella sp.]
MKKTILTVTFALLASCCLLAQEKAFPAGGADERTPSKAEYFSWINNTNEGATEAQTRINLDFFRWMKEQFGMQLDIYAFDAGAVDGAKMYGSTRSARFRRQFPNGFGGLGKEADRLGIHFGLWGGPDGFGTTDQEMQEREEMMVELVRDYGFRLFKMDAVCGQLRPEKYAAFDRMMTRVREIAPDFVLLNHRLQLGEATRHSTTYLLGGEETYIDVFMTNSMTAPHHRAQAIARKAPDNLTRLTEDHGVCLSSCLDGWQDDLVLQAFNRNLILAPQIYANPWLLRDDEFPQLAYFYNLHRRYRDLLVEGMRLPEAVYGPEAISRGTAQTRFLTLRNLTWEPVKYRVRLDGEVGLEKSRKKVNAKLYYPYVTNLGSHTYGSSIEVEVLPFRVALLRLTTEGRPGDDRDLVPDAFTSRKPYYHYKVADMQRCPVPEDVESYYYATCFAADNNALEARSLKRSGDTAVPQVKAARDVFFSQPCFKAREIWDRYLFDGDRQTAFSIAMRWGDVRHHGQSGFHLDLGEPQRLDKLLVHTFDEYSLAPLKSEEGVQAYVSADLKRWSAVTFLAGKDMEIDLSAAGEVRYIRFSPCPLRLNEVEGYHDGRLVDRTNWRANNLFRTYGSADCVAYQTWKSSFTLSADSMANDSYLCVALNGVHGVEGAWVGFRIDGEYVGCPDRSPSFTSNTWEYRSASSDRNYTYYLPLTKDMAGKEIEVVAMALGRNNQYVNSDRPDTGAQDPEPGNGGIRPEIWLTSHPL